MSIRAQIATLLDVGAEFVVVGGQAGVLRQAIEFSHDLDILIRPTRENAARVRQAVQRIAHTDPDEETLLGRDFQQYCDSESGEEIDVHLKLIALPDWEAGVRNSSLVELSGLSVRCLELPALYASKRTDRPRDALHREAIEHRLRALVLGREVAPDDIVLSCCLDSVIAGMPEIATRLATLAAETQQPLLQARLIACGPYSDALSPNPHLHPAVRAMLALEPEGRAKLLGHPARFAAFLSRLPLLLPAEGYHVRRPA